MNTIKNIEKEIENLQLIDGDFNTFSLTEYHRDFEITLHDLGGNTVKTLLKGVVSSTFISIVTHDNYSLDDKQLQEDLMPPYDSYHWGIKSFPTSNISISDTSQDLLKLQQNYNFKLLELTFETNSSTIRFIFNEFKIIKKQPYLKKLLKLYKNLIQ